MVQERQVTLHIGSGKNILKRLSSIRIGTGTQVHANCKSVKSLKGIPKGILHAPTVNAWHKPIQEKSNWPDEHLKLWICWEWRSSSDESLLGLLAGRAKSLGSSRVPT